MKSNFYMQISEQILLHITIVLHQLGEILINSY